MNSRSHEQTGSGTQELTNLRANLAADIRRNAHCSVCGNSLSFHQQWAGDICDDWRCRWTRLESDIEAHRRETARVIGQKHPETFRALVVPHRPGTPAGLPLPRRVEHLRLLREAVMTAAHAASDSEEPVYEAGDPVVHEPPHCMAGAVCAVCGGACCHRGGDQAFLDAANLQRITANNCLADSCEIVALYASHLPERSMAGSCVYHTPDGCALPRHLRSDICNTHRCRGLKQAERWIRDQGATRLYVVVRENNIIRRSAFVQDGCIRNYPPADSLIRKENNELPTSNAQSRRGVIE